MLDSLTNRLTGILDRLRGFGRLTEDNIQEALREVRVALLEADVNFKVVKGFIDRVRVKAVGMNDWPPKPGLTDMTSTRSRSSSTYWRTSGGVEGLSATPDRAPASRIKVSVRSRWVDASACTVT